MRCALLAALCVLAFAVAAVAQPAPSKKQIEEINEQFADRSITAKMDLPIVRSVYVRPDGEYDRERYQDRLSAQPPSLLRDDTAKLTKIEVDGDKVNVSINGGGMPRPRGKAFVIGGRKRRGSRIEIEFGRKVTAADLTPDMIVRAVSKIISIDGMDSSVALARPEELLGNVPASLDSAPKSPVPAAAPQTVGPINLQVLSAEVAPTRIRAGEKIALVVHYEVANSSSSVEVVEERQIVFEGRPLFSQPVSETVRRATGRHASSFELNVPSTAKPGVYTLQVKVRVGDLAISKEALFQVQ